MAGQGIRHESLRLSNVADGELDEQFLLAKKRVMEELHKAHKGIYAPDASGKIKSKVKLEVEFSLDVETLALFVAGRVSGITLPSLPKKKRAAFFSGDDIIVEAARQEPLPLEEAE